MFLYIFENGSIDQRLAMPDTDDLSAIGNGYLSVIRFSEHRFETLTWDGTWEEVEWIGNRRSSKNAISLSRDRDGFWLAEHSDVYSDVETTARQAILTLLDKIDLDSDPNKAIIITE